MDRGLIDLPATPDAVRQELQQEGVAIDSITRRADQVNAATPEAGRTSTRDIPTVRQARSRPQPANPYRCSTSAFPAAIAARSCRERHHHSI